MRRPVFALTAIALGFLGGDLVRGGRAQEKPPQLPPPEQARWDLIRDFKIDGAVDEAEHVRLELQVRDNRISGRLENGKAGANVNASTFSGEVVTREKPLLILRQDHGGNRYVLIHAGHLVGANHYRGTWHDNGGKSGDFELKLIK